MSAWDTLADAASTPCDTVHLRPGGQAAVEQAAAYKAQLLLPPCVLILLARAECLLPCSQPPARSTRCCAC